MSIELGLSSSISNVPDNTIVVMGFKRDTLLHEAPLSIVGAGELEIERVMKAKGFSFEKGKSLHIAALPDTGDIFLVGLGEEGKFNSQAAEETGAIIHRLLEKERAKDAHVVVDEKAAPGVAAQMALGLKLDSYRFDKYLTRETEDKKPSLGAVVFVVKDVSREQAAFDQLKELAAGIFLTRDLVSEPANVITPRTFVMRVKDALEPYADSKLKIRVLDEEDMEREGMGSILAVSQGSANPPRLLVVEYKGLPESAPEEVREPIVLVGKGITFDSGGLSIKPAASMEDMKTDMAGAAAVAGAMRSLAATNAPVNVVGIMALAENMTGSKAYRPGDIIETMSGQTVEVLNTDAEGRLVLNDAMWYGQTYFNPRAMIDLATLTGAIISALGKAYAGEFSNDDALAKTVEQAGLATGEKVWRMPWRDFDSLMDSPNADMKNTGGAQAGSGSAAAFLHRYVMKDDAGKETPWVHLDIAGVGRNPEKRQGTGWGVRLLDYFARASTKEAQKAARKTTRKKAQPKLQD